MLPARFKATETPDQRARRILELEYKITALRQQVEHSTQRLEQVCATLPIETLISSPAVRRASAREQARLGEREESLLAASTRSETSLSSTEETVEACKGVVKGHIDRLHQYNEMRDFGCGKFFLFLASRVGQG
ncbi:hypothetical protein BCR37DRAFT_381414 [Protomyces lactucae-debilis]|uniref:Uncharacterized protein n=1 Tax=Protomyces lactucae-debilis TaxID=2754530 RepID=A0A1Y2F974_PROLT|nr:uncharacterized protein BCR37DRAFT_381414 [Protomyces lactucae-debilis]ORY79984.1 hypothetical protein BCR37DRAFT_381414 [Protomyces lactucae-debilis]